MSLPGFDGVGRLSLGQVRQLVGLGTVSGALAANEAQDRAALSDAVVFIGTLAANEAQDYAAVSDGGPLAANEAQDDAAFSGELATFVGQLNFAGRRRVTSEDPDLGGKFNRY
jgi:hypothetical protein